MAKGKVARPLHRLRAYREVLREMCHSSSYHKPERFALRKALTVLDEQFPELGDYVQLKKTLAPGYKVR